MQQVVDRGETGVLDDRRSLLHLLRGGPVAQHPEHGVQSSLGHVVELLVEGGRVGLDGEGPQHLTGVAPERCAQLHRHRVAGRHEPPRGVLRRVRPARLGHRRHPEVVDVGRPAEGHVGALHEVCELPLAQSAPQTGRKRAQARVGERRTHAEPLDLLGGLDLPQRGVVGVEVDHLDAGLHECVAQTGAVRPDQPDRACTVPTPVQLGEHAPDQGGSHPLDLCVAGQLPGLRNVVEEAHEQGVGRVAVDDRAGLAGHRPPGDPGHGGAVAVGAQQQDALDAALGRDREQRLPPANHLGVAETGMAVVQQVPRHQALGHAGGSAVDPRTTSSGLIRTSAGAATGAATGRSMASIRRSAARKPIS